MRPSAVDGVRDRMAPGSAMVLYASNSTYFPMPPEGVEAFTAPLPPGGTAELAHLAPVSQLAYPLSKMGVRALVKREAKSFGERGVRLISVSPGAIDTPMTKDEVPNSKEAPGDDRQIGGGPNWPAGGAGCRLGIPVLGRCQPVYGNRLASRWRPNRGRWI